MKGLSGIRGHRACAARQWPLEFQSGKVCLFLKAFCNFAELLGVARFVVRNHLEPGVVIQAAEKGMLPAVCAQLPAAVLFEQRQRAAAQLASPTSMASFSSSKLGSSGTGVLKRKPRHSASRAGMCSRFQKGTGGGALLTSRAAPLVIFPSTMVRWAITSAADHAPGRGGFPQNSAGTAPAADSRPARTALSFSMMGVISAI